MTKIDIEKMRKMLISGARSIANDFEYINELNIFPVPDGDTGSNMRITTEGAISELEGKEFKDFGDFGKAYSRALLMNARGNSGVIFSQIMKGFTSAFKAGSTEFTLSDLPLALNNAKEFAYKSLTTPIEGTILTVIRLTAEAYNKEASKFDSLSKAFEFIVKASKDALALTPTILEELKNANVVDSGGYGLCKFFEGMEAELNDKKISNEKSVPVKETTHKSNVVDGYVDNNEGFGYCCEFIMTLGSKVSLSQKNKSEFLLNDFKEELSKIGDCLVVVRDENIVKVHIHSLTPYKVLEIGSRYGEFNKVKVENMTLQFIKNNPNTTLAATYKNEPNVDSEHLTKPLVETVKVIVTLPTSKLEELFINELHVDYVINYESSSNPSIQDFLNAFKKVKSSKIILVIDDSNIVLAAKEAVNLVKNTLDIRLINAKDVAASYLSCLANNPLDNPEKNFKKMVKSTDTNYAKIAQASKDVKYSGISITKNDFIGLIDKNVVCSNKHLSATAIELVDKLANKSRISSRRSNKTLFVFYGKNAPIDITRSIERHMSEHYNVKTKLISTDQEIYHYHFIFSI